MTDAAAEEDYIKTTTHNFISRKALIEGPRQVALQGRSIVQDGVKIRGDLGILRIGRYVRIDANTELEPPPMLNASSLEEKRIPMMIGNHTRILPNCKIQAAAIGSMVIIGENVQIGQRCIIKDCCIIDNDVVLGHDTVVPPFTRIFMDPKTTNNQKLQMQELPPSMTVDLQEQAMDQYDAFANERRAR